MSNPPSPLDPEFITTDMVDVGYDPPLFCKTAEELHRDSRAVAAKGALQRKLAAKLADKPDNVAVDAELKARLEGTPSRLSSRG